MEKFSNEKGSPTKKIADYLIQMSNSKQRKNMVNANKTAKKIDYPTVRKIYEKFHRKIGFLENEK
jgi:hypothetical protein